MLGPLYTSSVCGAVAVGKLGWVGSVCVWRWWGVVSGMGWGGQVARKGMASGPRHRPPDIGLKLPLLAFAAAAVAPAAAESFAGAIRPPPGKRT